jgi:hypothetical protein
MKKEPQASQTTIGMYDRALVSKITMGVTINLLNFENIKIDVEGTDPENNRKALIEILSTIIPAQNEVRAECIRKYMQEILIKKLN